MTLWLSAHFLLAGLFLSVSALTPEECQPLVTPLPLDDLSKLHGTMNFILGYCEHPTFKAMLKSADSYRMNITESPFSSRQVVMHQSNSINGRCIYSSVNVTFDGNTAIVAVPNMITTYHVLPSCDTCMLLSANSTGKHLDNMFRFFNLNGTVTEEEISTRALYLMARELTVKDSDLEHFKQQASCLGFSGEPEFHYDTKKGFCEEGEGLRVTVS